MERRSPRFRRVPLWLALFAIALSPLVAHADNSGIITGRVLEKDGKTPVAYASVSVLKTGRGSMTDDDGNFTIPAVPAGGYP